MTVGRGLGDRSCFEAERWGLCEEAVASLGDDLYTFWEGYRSCLVTKTRDTSEQAYVHMRGQLTMDGQRNFAHIDERITGCDGQAMQHFMSNSPWSSRSVFEQLQKEISQTDGVQAGSVVILDESADEKAGKQSAGSARQHNGRLGKIGLCQVATCLGYANDSIGLWTLLDGELFLPEAWFGADHSQLRDDLGIPESRAFATKLELGLRMIARVQAAGVPFERVACDELYGRSNDFRKTLETWGLRYAAQVPASTYVYMSAPRVGIPKRRTKSHRPRTQLKILSRHKPREVREIAKDPRTVWQHVRVRPTERGWLEADFAVVRIWTVASGQAARPEWLVIRREHEGDCHYTLLNDPASTSEITLIKASCQRCWIERTFQDAKSELGWDEFRAQKYQAWEHHFALTALALWFIAKVKMKWQKQHPRDQELCMDLGVEVLPPLSASNVRELLQAVLPLPELSPSQARNIVASHFVRRARSTASRLDIPH